MTSPSCAAIIAACNWAVFDTSMVPARAGEAKPNVAATMPATSAARAAARISGVPRERKRTSRGHEDQAAHHPAGADVAVRERDREAGRTREVPRPARARDRDLEGDLAPSGAD